MNNQEPIYVVSAYDDYSDAYAVKFDSRAKAEILLHTEQYDFRVREMMTEDQFLAKWSKPADAFLDEAATNDKGYIWDDYNDCWIGIAVYNDYDYRTWFKSYELCKHWRKSDKLEDKIKLANNGDEADIDDLMKDPRWSQCKEIKEAAIVLYGDDKYLDKLVHDPDEDIRAAVASKWRTKDLDILVHDPSVKVRKEVAVYADQSLHTRKYFDILVNDESPEVRAMVAMKASHYGTQNNPYLDKLVHDPSADVRAEVAYYANKKHLDILVNDPSEDVRVTVARWGHRPKDLNKLVKDPSPLVRKEVALCGRDRNLAKLVDDPDNDVRKAAVEKVREKDLNDLQKMQKEGKISQKANLEIIADLLPEWRKSNKPNEKALLVRYGRDYDLAELTKARSIWRENEIVMKAIAEHDDGKEKK